MNLDRRSEPKTYQRVVTRYERRLIEEHEEERFRWTLIAVGAWVLAVILWAVFL